MNRQELVGTKEPGVGTVLSRTVQAEQSVYSFVARVLPLGAVLLTVLILSSGGETLRLLFFCVGHIVLNVAFSRLLSRFHRNLRVRCEIAKNFINVFYVTLGVVFLGAGSFLWTLHFLSLARSMFVFDSRVARLGSALLFGFSAGAAEYWYTGLVSQFFQPLIILLVPTLLTDVFFRFFEAKAKREREWRSKMVRSHERSHRLNAVGSLAAGIAHEINTPVQYVSSSLSFVEEGLADIFQLQGRYRRLQELALQNGDSSWKSRFREMETLEEEMDIQFLLERMPLAINRAKEGLQRVDEIVGALQRVAQPSKANKRLANINDMVRAAATVTQSRWKDCARLELELASLPLVSCYESELTQAFLNLILNAVEAIEARGEGVEDGVIGIRSSSLGGRLEVLFSDNGCGIPEERRVRIFDPFYSSKDVGAGIGTGLTVAHASICQRHGGVMSIESAEGQGTTVQIWMPVESETLVGVGLQN